MGYWIWNTKLIREIKQQRVVPTSGWSPGCNSENVLAVLEVVLSPPSPLLSPQQLQVLVCRLQCVGGRGSTLMSHAARLTNPICSILLAAQVHCLLWLHPWALVVPALGSMGEFKATIVNSCSARPLSSQQASNSMACCLTWELKIASFPLCWETCSSPEVPLALSSSPFHHPFSKENFNSETKCFFCGSMESLPELFMCLWPVSAKRGGDYVWIVYWYVP